MLKRKKLNPLINQPKHNAPKYVLAPHLKQEITSGPIWGRSVSNDRDTNTLKFIYLDNFTKAENDSSQSE